MLSTQSRTPAHAARPVRPGTLYGPIALRGRPVRPVRFLAGLVVLAVLIVSGAVAGYRFYEGRSTHAAREALGATVWPAHGQAAYARSGEPGVRSGPGQRPAPIASVAKVMTAYLILRDHPLTVGADGPTLRLGSDDVQDTERRRSQQESVVPVADGEELTERQALEALLLPSANNIAAALARWNSGTEQAFVAEMNEAAGAMGMSRTHYTDPSGYDAGTVSTAADQVQVVQRAMRLPLFAHIVGLQTAELPVAGTVHNTDTLLGKDGFVGVKTGSDDAAGGCFAFRAVRWIGGTRTVITGVVLGQPGHNQLGAGLAAADAMVDRIAGA